MEGSAVKQVAADIVGAYTTNNSVPASELPELIAQVYAALKRLVEPQKADAENDIKPAVPIKKSVFADHVVCLVCGSSHKTLRRHLFAQHGLSPSAYRERFALPSSYSIVAADYAAARSKLAKASGLGSKRTQGSRSPAPIEKVKTRRGRTRKA